MARLTDRIDVVDVFQSDSGDNKFRMRRTLTLTDGSPQNDMRATIVCPATKSDGSRVEQLQHEIGNSIKNPLARSNCDTS